MRCGPVDVASRHHGQVSLPPPSSAGPGALAQAVGSIGDRWSLLVVAALLDGPRRFGELQGDVAGIATNVLAQRLRQLDAAGVVVARPYSQRPVRVAYELSGSGRELAGALRLLAQWGADRAGSPAAGVAHRACGTTLEARWWCPTCDEPVDDPDDGPVVWA